MSSRCLYCYEPLESSGGEYHPRCAQRLFGIRKTPVIDIGMAELEELARREINQRISVPGVQRKLSLDLVTQDKPRLTIVGLWGKFIFKPPAFDYAHLPEIEDFCMHLAGKLGIRVAVHGLVRLRGNELGYLCRRFDRDRERRLAVEDFCQLTETLTADKYYSSVEKVGKVLHRYSDNPGLDAQRLLEVVLFSYLTGNADMHLKNYALLRDSENELGLAPAYDLVSTTLVLPEDKEESALSINGRKHKLRRADFESLSDALKVDRAFFNYIIERWSKQRQLIKHTIQASFMPAAVQNKFAELIEHRFAVLEA